MTNSIIDLVKPIRRSRLCKGLMAVSLSVCAAVLLAAETRTAVVETDPGGGVHLTDPDVRFVPRLVYPRWLGQANGESRGFAADGVRRFSFLRETLFDPAAANPSATKAKGTVTATGAADGGVAVSYRLTFPATVSLAQVGLQAELPQGRFRNGTVTLDGRSHPLRLAGKDDRVAFGKAAHVAFADPQGRLLMELVFAQPTLVHVMAPRPDSARGFTFRIAFAADNPIAAGTEIASGFTVRGPLPLEADDGRLFAVRAGKDWIPLALDSEIAAGSAADMTLVTGRPAPCGTFGRVVREGDHFAFEKNPGVARRFYGANVCFSACYPTKAQADWLCETLVRCGYNAVRYHHFDTSLTSDGSHVDSARIARLDNLVASCAEHGLYITTDLFVGRRTPWKAVGVDRPGVLSQNEFKAWIFFHEPLRQNFKAYIRELLTHVNGVSGVAYKDDPAIAFLALVNEGNPGNYGVEKVMEAPGARAAWERWCAERGEASVLPKSVYDRTKASALFNRFLAAVEARHFADFRRFIREEIGCRALLSNMSAWNNPPAFQVPRARLYDYVDDHFYYDHPRFPVHRWCLPYSYSGENPLRKDGGCCRPALRRLLDAPFVVTEFNYVAPNPYRACQGLVFGAFAALQDWDGLWRFEWTMDEKDAFSFSGVPFSGKGFNAVGDPVQLATDRALAALYLRGDLSPHADVLALQIESDHLDRAAEGDPFNTATDWNGLGWQAKLGTVVGPVPTGVRQVWDVADYTNSLETATRKAQLRPAAATVDAASGAFAVATERTCGVFLETGSRRAGALAVQVAGAPAAVWATSLDGRGLGESRRILLTHLTDVLSDGTEFSGRGRRLLLKFGEGGYLMAQGTADVALEVTGRSYRIHALSSGGRRVAEVPCAVGERGELRFRCDVAARPNAATFLYEIERL